MKRPNLEAQGISSRLFHACFRLYSVCLPSMVVFFLMQLMACTFQVGRSHFVLAERLFEERKFEAAVTEYKLVIDANAKSAEAQRALYRIGTIQYLYLGQYEESVKTFQKYVFLSQDSELVYEAEKIIGEVYFSKIEDYRRAISQYKRLLGKYPDSLEIGFFNFRLGKSYYYRSSYAEARAFFTNIVKDKRISTALVEEAYYQIGSTYFTEAKYEEAVDAFESLIESFPNGKFTVLAQFGMANCFEEMDHLDEAYSIYRQIETHYPNPEIIKLKLRRVLARKNKRNR